MYLSRLILDIESRQVQKELSRPYEMHRTLMRAFPDDSAGNGENAREQFGVLFRAELEERNSRSVVHVQSIVEPNWSFLEHKNRYLLPLSSNPSWKDVSQIYNVLETGQTLRFRLRANPTKRIAKPRAGSEGLKGKRVGLLREEEQIAWLVRKGESGGFEILTKESDAGRIPRVDVTRCGKQFNWKKGVKESHRMTHLGVRFDGLLRVANAEIFRETLAKGIGPGKAFGFGLLSLARA